jgi:hypothetical protein
MPLYHIRLLGADGSLHEEHEIEREDDDAAIDFCDKLDHPHEIQIWDGGRLVGRFPPEEDRRNGP